MSTISSNTKFLGNGKWVNQDTGVRVEKGLTQSDVARISGLSTSMISKIESQYTVPSVKNFLRYIFRLRFGLGTCS
ncbi:helix-turn-helix transcriptional regulator [Levilactobacillus brevis]